MINTGRLEDKNKIHNAKAKLKLWVAYDTLVGSVTTPQVAKGEKLRAWKTRSALSYPRTPGFANIEEVSVLNARNQW